MNKSYWHYISIIIVILLGFILGGVLSFGVVFMDFFPSITGLYGRTILALFGMGVLGASTYCAKFWSTDIDEAVYEKPEFLPHIFDFVGYLTLIIGGGVTGVILFLAFKTGIGITVNGPSEVSLSKEASALIAYMGGLYHFKVQNQLGKVMAKVFQEYREKQAAKGGG